MKNLKKVLALVLALSTIFGLGISASAKYTDASSINYTEAVDVMSAIGVLGGNPDGSFAPEKNLTRAQAAKMVSFIMNGGKDVNDLYAGSCQFTDCYSSWAKGYIAFANQTGVVAGVGNGKFNPDGTLTGVQLAKMMLGALGYDANIEGYQANDNWALNILNDARSAGLLKGLDGVNMYTAITREQASQMMFNALQANMVAYSNKGTEITLPDGTSFINGASDAKAIEIENEGTANYAGKDGAGANKQQLCEVYFDTLKLSVADNADAFGRDANIWNYGKPSKEVGTYASEAELTYTAGVTGGDLWKDLGKPTIGTVKTYTDGKSNTGSATIAENNKDVIGGNGTLVEVYTTANEKSVDVDIVIINTYFGEVSAVTPAKGDNARTITVDSKKYETEEFAKGDKVLYTKADNTLKSVVAAESFTGKVTSVNTTKKTFTVDGTTYEWSAKSGSASVKADSEYTFYTDANGYVIAVDVVKEAADKYAVLMDVNNSGWTDAGDKDVKLLLADGTTVIVKAKNVDDVKKGDIVAYSVKDDVYTLSSVDNTSITAETVIKTGNASFDATNNFVADSKTVFMVKGGTASDPTYTVYTGISNVPGMTVKEGSVYAKDGVAQFVYITNSKLTGVSSAEMTYIDRNHKETIEDTTGTYDICNAIVNGEVTTVKVSSDATSVTGTGLYTAIVTDKDGIIIDATPAQAGDGKDYLQATGTKAENNGVVTLGGKAYGYTSDVTVFMINADGDITAGTISEIADDTNDTVMFTVNNNGVITSLYVTEVKAD